MMPEDDPTDEEVVPAPDAHDPKGTYAVGYGRPPVAHRFQPSESGNRRGRPRGSQSTAAVFEAMFKSTVAMTVEGKRRRLNKPAFRRRMLDSGLLEATGERETGASFRPAEFYRRRAVI